MVAARNGTRLVGALAAALVVACLLPTAAAHAVEDGLSVTTRVTYRYDPGVPTVTVDTEMTFVNETAPVTRGGVVSSKYWNGYGFVAVKEATGFHADSGGRSVSVRTEPAPSSNELVLVEFDFGRQIFYRDSVTVHVGYTIPATSPRTGGSTRVNGAFATFLAFAPTGDPGRTSVDIVVPSTFENVVSGEDMVRTRSGDATVFSAQDIAAPEDFFADVSSRNDDALVARIVDLDPGVVKVRAWPGDEQWADFVSTQVTKGIPALEDVSGLSWPTTDAVDVIESISPYLYGYAGWYQPVENLIEIGDELDPHVILHELSHVWLNDKMFHTRWIVEGMAEVVSSRAEAKLGGKPEAAKLPPSTDPGHQPLNTWSSPSLQSEISEEQEQYGYEAAYAVVDAIAREIGTARLQDVLAAADDRLIAYEGDVPREKVTRPADWQRFLDLVEEIGGAEDAERLFRDAVVDRDEAGELADRTDARKAYAQVEQSGGAWAPPFGLRRAMSEWEFERAATLTAGAKRILASRDALSPVLRRLDLTMPAGLEHDYEGAIDSLAKTRYEIDGATEAAKAIDRAQDAADGGGPLATIGGLLSSADDELSDARRLFEHGDSTKATAAATAAADDADAEAGTGARVLGGAGAVFLLSGLVAFLVLRRRWRGDRDQPADWGAPPAL